ncbi:MAG: Flp pilus assembly complex ATPase component TadA [Candidatus Magnetomorum sp.]|nr:Flp pilus assembly complex ATPase component TadA [Candidatus Magnetomorum sp.]
MLKIEQLEKILIDANILTPDQFQQAIEEHKGSGLDFVRYLTQSGLLSETDLAEILSHEAKVARYDPEIHSLQLNLIELVPLEIAQKNHLAPIQKRGRLLIVATTDPLNIAAFDAVEESTDCEVEPLVCTEQEFMQLITTIYGMDSGYTMDIDGIGEMEFDIDSESKSAAIVEDVQVSSLQNMAEEAPVIRFVNSLLSQAVRQGASDIHISPEKDRAKIRFRIDGRLQEVPSPPKAMLLPIISRIKILGYMDIATAMVPQDGRFTVKTENKEINVRASSIPTIHGENIVLRLLDMGATIHTLDRLGMTAEDTGKIKEVIEKPYGMILSTGPTGSGKSTSLYSIIKALNKPDINIITLEDPVEYRVPNVRQVQLNRKAGMTFASGLRSILRQDPDVIMVGEIRDSETAEIAVRSALTGHRVLSTVHTNDAAGAITRLIEMGIEPFIVSSVLLVSFAQRLLRTVCPFCKEVYQPTEKALRYIGIEPDDKSLFYRGRGCINCMGTGFRGRTAVFEILIIDEEIQDMIYRKCSAQEISRYSKVSGKLNTLKEDAMIKIFNGITTVEEAASVVMM